MKIPDITTLVQRICQNIETVIVGKHEVIELAVTALLANGHVLLEDIPGTGKTVMAKALARSVDCNFNRIQFTPDLLPSDITGLSIFNQREMAFEFRPGPAFTNILLCDEINRATPRTQSALLECMEERQITVDGDTKPLSAPFFVIATQNPVEIQGTFQLPEAQLDRFLVRLTIGSVGGADARAMLDRFIESSPLGDILPVATGAEVLDAQKSFSSVFVSDAVRDYIVAVAERTRTHPDVILGVSPRGMLAMLRLSQAYAAVKGRDYVLPDDIKTLCVPVFAHRIISRIGQGISSAKTNNILENVLQNVPVPTEDPSGN